MPWNISIALSFESLSRGKVYTHFDEWRSTVCTRGFNYKACKAIFAHCGIFSKWYARTLEEVTYEQGYWGTLANKKTRVWSSKPIYNNFVLIKTTQKKNRTWIRFGKTELPYN